MAQKYGIEYKDVVNVDHEIQIFDDSYVGDVIEVQGKAFLDSSKAEDHLDAIRGQGLRVELEANQDLTYSDLYSEEEKTFPVKYYRDSVLLFDGWLNPDGWFEDFVVSDWIVSFDCVDGLGYLESLSFVETDGTLISGKITQLEAIVKALARTGIEKDINTSIDIYYTGLSTSVDVLDNVYVIADRYIKDDGDTIMSCDEVIRDILEPYGAILKSYGDAWWIYKPNQMWANTTQSFYNYEYDGTVGVGFSVVMEESIGSHMNNFDIFHCSENQQLSIAPSTGAYRISYKYGLVKSFIENIKLISNDGTTIDDWDVVSTTNLDTPFPIGTGRVTFDNVAPASSIENLMSEEVQIDDATRVDVLMKWTTDWSSSIRIVKARYQIYVSDKSLPDGTANIYYLQDDHTWGSVGVSHTIETAITRRTDIEATTPVSPIAGTSYFYISVYTPQRTPVVAGDSELIEVSASPNADDNNAIGEFHTFQRTTKPSAQIQNIKEVATGDNETDLYVGTLYQSDSTTPTETWFRSGISEAKPILQLMGEELMRMNQSPTRVYRGDLFGFINYLEVITIDGLTGQWMVLEYSYDTQANITSVIMRQILGAELLDLDYEETVDKGETVKPTIVN